MGEEKIWSTTVYVYCLTKHLTIKHKQNLSKTKLSNINKSYQTHNYQTQHLALKHNNSYQTQSYLRAQTLSELKLQYDSTHNTIQSSLDIRDAMGLDTLILIYRVILVIKSIHAMSRILP